MLREEKKKIKFLHQKETTAIGKSFMQNWIKSRKYFSAHQYQNFWHNMACTHPIQLGSKGKGERGFKNFSKVFARGGRCQKFLFWLGGYIVGGVNFVGGEGVT